MNAEEQQNLIRSVFGTPDGEKLLELMLREYVIAPIFTKDPYVLASRAGVQDFITNLTTQIGDTENEQ